MVSACKDELINIVMNLSDSDNLLVAAFIAGLQTGKTISLCNDHPTQAYPPSQSLHNGSS